MSEENKNLKSDGVNVSPTPTSKNSFQDQAQNPPDSEESGGGFEKQVIDLLGNLTNKVGGLEDRMGKVELKSGLANATAETAAAIGGVPKDGIRVGAKYDITDDDTFQGLKIHPKHRQIVDEVLGKQFRAWESYEGVNTTEFLFNVEVPPAFSSVPKKQHVKAQCDHDNDKCLLPPDLRSKAIGNAEGENGVREWCIAIKRQLTQFYNSTGAQTPFTAQ